MKKIEFILKNKNFLEWMKRNKIFYTESDEKFIYILYGEYLIEQGSAK
jgi:hypothetical protein